MLVLDDDLLSRSFALAAQGNPKKSIERLPYDKLPQVVVELVPGPRNAISRLLHRPARSVVLSK